MKKRTGAAGQIWRMVKADLFYNRAIFIVLYTIFLIFTVFNVIYGRLERFMLQIILFSIALIGIFTGNEEAKSKGTRRMMLVPVSIGRIAAGRQVILVLYIFSLMSLLIFSSLLAGQGWPEQGFLLRVVSMSGLLFIITSCMDIFFNLKFIMPGSGSSIIVRGLVLAVAITSVAIYILFMNIVGKRYSGLARTLTSVFAGFPAAWLIFAAGAVLVALTSVVFKARKEFVD